MAENNTKTIDKQITLLKSRGMIMKDKNNANNMFSRISYYRLEVYWWDIQINKTLHIFGKNACFENVIIRYEFDQKLRSLLFKSAEIIEISLRSKLIYLCKSLSSEH
ncbi:MAG: Abi family protein [Candidatus Marinimicrobia bacterium]|nr:Abi family protein [Candidatus Neomarinimicrobiota bacterium]